jgi:hypothetical protein
MQQWDRPTARTVGRDQGFGGMGKAATSGRLVTRGSHFILLASPYFPPSSSTFGHFGPLGVKIKLKKNFLFLVSKFSNKYW